MSGPVLCHLRTTSSKYSSLINRTLKRNIVCEGLSSGCANNCINEGYRSFFSLPGSTSRRKEYVGKRVVGFTREEMFTVVSGVETYKEFVPFCTRSDVISRSDQLLIGKLQIGFPPLVESYSSRVVLKRPHLVNADCTDGRLFDHLKTSWRFDEGLRDKPRSCRVSFYLSFEFKSVLHSHLANLFFNELVRTMEEAFLKEAERRYGRPSIPTILLKS